MGRKPLVLIGLLVAGGGTIWVGFTDTVPMFLVADRGGRPRRRACCPRRMQATVADVIGTKGRGGPVLAAFQMAADVGAILGPIVAGLLADHMSYLAAFAVTGALCLRRGGRLAARPGDAAPRGDPTDDSTRRRRRPLATEQSGQR